MSDIAKSILDDSSFSFEFENHGTLLVKVSYIEDSIDELGQIDRYMEFDAFDGLGIKIDVKLEYFELDRLIDSYLGL